MPLGFGSVPIRVNASSQKESGSNKSSNTSSQSNANVSANSEPNKGGKEPTDKGKKGEKMGGADSEKDKERYVEPTTGKDRIADISTEKELGEIKYNEKPIVYYGSQIKDGIAHAFNTGRTFVLKVLNPDKVTKPLKEAAANSNGNVRIVPLNSPNK